MHLAPLIFDLAIILAVAGIMSFICTKIKQPVVLGYIVAGVIVGPHTPPAKLIVDIPSLQTWAELGVIFLMFTLGLEFSFRKLLGVGVTAGISAGLEVIFFLIVGYGVGQWLGWTSMDSIFLGAMLSISSTTIIIKALDELKLKSHRFASLIFGILIVEDLFAILLLVGLTTIAISESVSVVALLSAGLNLLLVVGSWFITGYFIVPRMLVYIGRKGNNEMLTLVAIGLCLLLVVLASRFGYSPALGAFIMGSIIAETEIIHRIEGLMAPLKDLFGAIFFVSIGMLIDPAVMWEYKGTILFLSFITIFGKIFSTSLGALISGQSFRNSLQVGMGLAQIGEFSFIIAGLGLTLKATSNILYPIGVAVSLVTTFTTPYLIKYSGTIADKIEVSLPMKFRTALHRYMIWTEHRKTGHSQNKELILLISRWLLNGILVTFIFKVSFKYLAPLDFAIMARWGTLLTWIFAFTVSMPFIWGMIFTTKENYLKIRSEKNFFKALLVFSFPILTSIWIGVLSAEHFPIGYIILITTVMIFVIYFWLYKRLESSYQWFENAFLQTFKQSREQEENQLLNGLAPWDSHLVNVEVHSNANLVNKSLTEANLRNKHGINIVAVQRGMLTIIAPKPHEKILPKDVLVILGTDEQIGKVRPDLEIPINIPSHIPQSGKYRLRHVLVKEKSSLAGKSIRMSGIRETYHAMVVGIERENSRIINPDTDLILQENDILWIVGEVSMLDALMKEINCSQ